MPHATRERQSSSDRDTWPWACVRCGGTVYHDAARCGECETGGSPSRQLAPPPRDRGFIDWMREQSLGTFVSTVAAVASLELLMTAVWLQLLVATGPIGLPVAG